MACEKVMEVVYLATQKLYMVGILGKEKSM